jgi:hypothetical protein
MLREVGSLGPRTCRVLLSADRLAAQGVNGVWDTVDPSALALAAWSPPCERR